MSHPPAQPHGKIEEVFPDVFFVTGIFRAGAGFRFPRNMTILRSGERLVLVNSVRLTADGETELDKLGKVTDVVRLGGFHGIDDPYYRERYQATMWAPANIRKPRVEYRPLGPDSPLEDARVFLFEKGREPDAALIVARAGGILVSCDSFQNWTSMDGVSLLARPIMKLMGFGPAVIGGPWVKRMGPAIREDFERLRKEPFQHLLSGHGTPLRDRARDELAGAMARRFK